MAGHNKKNSTIKKMIATNNRMINALNNKFKLLKGRAPARTNKHKVKSVKRKSSGCGCS